ncbi:MAG: SpoIID/LytB domain-containing protein [bacterium]|nr:SpoIID/LytB domain-containing protein [bacterium]
MKKGITGILFVAIAIVLAVSSCSKDSNPALPGAPEQDVITLVDRNAEIRVGLLSFTPQKNIFISSTTGSSFKCYLGDTLAPFVEEISGNIIKFTGQEEKIEYSLTGSDDSIELNGKTVRIEPSEGNQGGYLMVGPGKNSIRAYRGRLTLILEGKNILVVNTLPLEEYLLGVVPAEMDPSWPEEALITQAIVSRTYAIFNLKRYDGRGFDIADDQRSQRYGGISVETAKTTEVVQNSVNKIITFNSRLASVVFHAESGGQTASNLDVWPHSGDIPYLAGTSDALGVMDFSAGGHYDSWSNLASFEDLRAALNQDGETFVGSYLSSITVLGRSENGRVQSIDILGEKNPVVSAMTFINVLNQRIREDFIPSNQFTISFENGSYRFSGSGKGHGVGLSQWGTYVRASNDQGYEFIIQQYFPGTEISEIPTEGIEVVHNSGIDMIR